MLKPQPPVLIRCGENSQFVFSMPSGSNRRGFRYRTRGSPVTFWTIADSI
jgi:hypothetical protein